MAVKVREIPEGSGKWYVKVDYHQRRVAKCFGSEERARDVASKVATAIDIYGLDALRMFRAAETTPVQTIIPTVAEFAARWSLELERRDLKLSTRISYKSNLKHHILPAFGNRLISEIDYALLKEFVCSKADETYITARFRKRKEDPENRDGIANDTSIQERKYSRDSIRIMVMTMRAMMAEAVREKLIPTNPVADLATFYRKQKQERTVRRSDVYTPEELYAIEDILQSKRSLFEPNTYELVLCMSRTGMRVGEVRGLMFSDLDYHTRTIVVQRNIPSGHNRLEETTKGRQGHRTVNMGEDLYLALKEMDDRRNTERLKSGKKTSSSWVFRTTGGIPMDYNKLYNDWSRAQKIAGVRIRSPHSLRHTYASVNLAEGEDLAYISRQLGHANPSITLAIYTHFIPNKGRGTSNALDRTQTIRKPSTSNNKSDN